jgi:hypothetical protein
MLHSTLSMHSETVEQPRTTTQTNAKSRPVVESRELLFDSIF